MLDKQKDKSIFFFGRSLPHEISAALDRVGSFGISYPEGYASTLVKKYEEVGVCYPHILMISGSPRINHHFMYPQVLRRNGPLLDYGCGTGDNVRQLIRDGFPREKITAFDINHNSIDLGFDLYLDREKLGDLFVVSNRFLFRNIEFDTIYSASVIHVIADDVECKTYLNNVYTCLRDGGIFFGSTLGMKEERVRSPGVRGPPRILTRDQLNELLIKAGFTDPEIIQHQGIPDYIPYHEEMCFFEFCTKKPTMSVASQMTMKNTEIEDQI
jgi:SAM-dependent methyltransferase